jgi:hypothetical protein
MTKSKRVQKPKNKVNGTDKSKSKADSSETKNKTKAATSGKKAKFENPNDDPA